ncbi:MAG: hypothetical protein LBN11_00810 [Tannerella sp.]|jgi:hypothetical protein|nr:hypothetical protein [Tannerella sp.]
MRKYLMVFTAVLLLFASCEGPVGPMGPKGDKGDGTYWFVKTYTINSNQWKLVNGSDNIGSFYQAEVVIPELDEDIYEEGNVFCYLFQTVDGVEVQTPLPYNIPWGEVHNNGEESLWTEFYFYDFTKGSIMFYAYYSDFYTSNRPPTASFRVVLNY